MMIELKKNLKFYSVNEWISKESKKLMDNYYEWFTDDREIQNILQRISFNINYRFFLHTSCFMKNYNNF